MTDYTTWLGPAADDMTTEQRARFDQAATAYAALPYVADRTIGDPDYATEDDAALTAIVQAILDEDTLTAVAARARAATEALDGWIRASAALGASERDIETGSGLARMTVRKRLGR